MRLLLIFLFISTPIFAASSLMISPYDTKETIEKESWEWKAEGRYLITDSYFDKSGATISMPQGKSFNRSEGVFQSRYGVTDYLDLSLAALYRKNNSTTALTEQSASGIESLFSSLRYSKMLSAAFTLTGVAKIKYALYSPEFYGSEASAMAAKDLALGDGGQEYELGANLTYKVVPSFYLRLYSGYVIPPTHLSHELRYEAEAAYTWSNQFAFLVGAEGAMTRGMIKESEWQSYQLARGTTTLYNSYNADYLRPYLAFNISLGSFRIETKGAMVMSGRNTDSYKEFTVGLLYNSAVNKSEKLVAGKFKEYFVEGEVVKLSSRNSFVKIDKGGSDSVEKGMKVDFYKKEKDNIRLAGSGIVYEVGGNWSFVKVKTTYNGLKIEEGLMAKVQSE